VFARPVTSRTEARAGTTAVPTSERSAAQQASGRQQETELANPIAEASSGLSWRLGDIPLFPPDPAARDRNAPAAIPASVAHAPPIVHAVVQSPGRPLDPATRNFFEPRFGHDLSSVRVHTDARADASAQAVNANAYTVGQNIVFGAGQFAPHQPDGRKLLAHELAHVIQQRRPQDARTGPGNCEQDAENAAHSIESGIAPIVGTRAVFGAVQRQASAAPAQKKSRLVRIERYWRSTSARAFFADGSNEEVTFVDTSSLDKDFPTGGKPETMANLVIDRSSQIRPHVEFAPGRSGSNVKIVTRLSPADRISRLPARVRGEVSEAFLGDAEDQPDPATMEFAADMGDKLKETSGTTRIEVEGRDPATVAAMKAVDQWVGEQKSSLDKVGQLHRARFTQLLKDIRQVGVTGPVKAEDLSAQDIELVLAGAAGGQSEFETFDRFKDGMKFKLRTGRASVPEQNADNPDFFIRNEYRKAWKAEAAGLRKMSRIAEAAQYAPFIAIGASAAVGSGLALGEAGVAALVARGVPYAVIGKWIGTSLIASSVASHLGSARDEAREAGIDPNSLRGLVSSTSAAILRGTGLGDIAENVTNTSMQTGKSLDRSPLERVVGTGGGILNMFGLSEGAGPESPGKLPTAGESSAAKGIEDVDTTAGTDPAASPDPAAQPEAQGNAGRTSQSAELDIPGPHPFFKKPAGNENFAVPPPEAQAAEIPLAETGTGGSTPAVRIAGEEAAQTGTGAGGTKMSGTETKPDPVKQWEQGGGTVKRPKYGESGEKDPRLRKPAEPPEITARPKDRPFEEEREEKLGPAEDSPEVAANQSARKSAGKGEPPVRAEVGNFAHNRLPGYLERMRADLASAKTPEARAELEQHIAELEAMTEWPAGLEPNPTSFEMSDGRQGIPDGIDARTTDKSIVYELKPDTESEWAKGGEYQASEYAEVLNQMRYAGRTNWVGKVVIYKAKEMTALLRKWGVLPPEPSPKTE